MLSFDQIISAMHFSENSTATKDAPKEQKKVLTRLIVNTYKQFV